ncbi:MAG: HNH endonuclease, partial [Chloroflexi bacterium CFX6]|nr:HNH endonuclease [Chloroflexi bacterium CFX6]
MTRGAARILRALLLVRPAARLPMDEWRLVRRAILIRDDDRCRCRRWWGWGPTCGRPAEHVDHVVPVSWGGSSDGSNLRAACARCNLRKGGRPPAGWLA